MIVAPITRSIALCPRTGGISAEESARTFVRGSVTIGNGIPIRLIPPSLKSRLFNVFTISLGRDYFFVFLKHQNRHIDLYTLSRRCR